VEGGEERDVSSAVAPITKMDEKDMLHFKDEE
jgi:hypothetical protein